VRRAVAWPAPRLQEQPGRRLGKELERKYLVDVAAWKLRDDGVHDKQGVNRPGGLQRSARLQLEPAPGTVQGLVRDLTRSLLVDDCRRTGPWLAACRFIVRPEPGRSDAEAFQQRATPRAHR
jgi:hypothetical protein